MGLFLDLEQAAGDFQQALARISYGDLLLAPVEQDEVVFLLELANLVRYRRLGQVQRFGGTRKSAADGDMVEGAELDLSHGLSPGFESIRGNRQPIRKMYQ